MGAHAEWYPEAPDGCRCELTQYPGADGWFVTGLSEHCPMHGRPENLGPGATQRQREISERKWT